MLKVLMLSVLILCVDMRSVILQSVVMLNVVAPSNMLNDCHPPTFGPRLFDKFFSPALVRIYYYFFTNLTETF